VDVFLGVVERYGVGGNVALQEKAVVLALKTIKQVFY
jgi:hypothetical protein